MLGVGLGSFVLGALRAEFSFESIFRAAILLPLIVAGLAMLTIKKNQTDQQQKSSTANKVLPLQETVRNGVILCPACGGENPEDAIFCANHQCHKSLGEFKYVLEEFQAETNWILRLADTVTNFIAKPHFIIFHMFWFVVWILVNEGFLGQIANFDQYPYDLLSIILAIEAVFITGFLLISQNHQAAYAEKRSELDYEVNIRSYRKLIELEKRLDNMQQTLGSR